MRPQKQPVIDSGSLIRGLLLGLLVGGLVALFRAPIRSKIVHVTVPEPMSAAGQSLGSHLEAVVPADPIAESRAAGKAAARRRRDELGLSAKQGH